MTAHNCDQKDGVSTMNKHSKLYAIISYITWIGWLVAFFAREKDDTLVRRHLNQALIINIAETAGRIIGRLGGIFSVIAEIIDIAVLVFFIMGIVRACKQSEEPLPVIGEITLID